MNFNNGMGAVTGLIPGTTITLDFDTSGRVSGKAGCNTYFANYRAGGNSLSVDRPGATNMFCDSPEGVMQQEQQYLAALQSAATFRSPATSCRSGRGRMRWRSWRRGRPDRAERAWCQSEPA